MTKKVHTITFQHVLNYGAVLQAYALAKFLKNHGFDVEVLDYRPSYFMYQTYRPRKGIFKTINKLKKNIRFYRFRKKYLPLTRDIFFTTKSLEKKYRLSHEAFITGSDQVWNKELTDNKVDNGYFLNFLPNSALRVSYAASIGNTPFEDADKKHLKKILAALDTVLVREDFAQKQITEITDGTIHADVVIDPTLLLSDYDEILDFSLVPDQPYLVSYLTEDSKEVREYIEHVREITKLPLINLGHHEISSADKNYLYESPSKWLGVFSKATMVCTNSFHGNAYALIFKRNFTVFSRVTKKQLNRRQLTLLEKLGLQDRFIPSLNDFKEHHLEGIDYDKVLVKYQELVTHSKDKLLKALKS